MLHSYQDTRYMERALFSAKGGSEFSHLVKLVPLLMLCSLVTSCVAAKPAEITPQVVVIDASEQTQEKDVEHVIAVNGETLGIIAKWYTGDSKNWPAILKANKKLVPEKLRLGQVIVIPRDIVKERSKMTSDFVSKEVRNIKRAVVQIEQAEPVVQDGVGDVSSGDVVNKNLERSKNTAVGATEARDGRPKQEPAQPAQHQPQQSPTSQPSTLQTPTLQPSTLQTSTLQPSTSQPSTSQLSVPQLRGQKEIVPLNLNPASNTIKQEMKLKEGHSEVKDVAIDKVTIDKNPIDKNPIDKNPIDEETLEREKLLKELLGK